MCLENNELRASNMTYSVLTYPYVGTRYSVWTSHPCYYSECLFDVFVHLSAKLATNENNRNRKKLFFYFVYAAHKDEKIMASSIFWFRGETSFASSRKNACRLFFFHDILCNRMRTLTCKHTCIREVYTCGDPAVDNMCRCLFPSMYRSSLALLI